MSAFLVAPFYRGDDGWVVHCTCGFGASAPDGDTARRMVAQHEIAHRVVEAHS